MNKIKNTHSKIQTYYYLCFVYFFYCLACKDIQIEKELVTIAKEANKEYMIHTRLVNEIDFLNKQQPVNNIIELYNRRCIDKITLYILDKIMEVVSSDPSDKTNVSNTNKFFNKLHEFSDELQGQKIKKITNLVLDNIKKLYDSYKLTKYQNVINIINYKT